jgi:hypothetical protein
MAATKELEQTVSTTQLAEAFAAAMRSVAPAKEPKEGDPEYVARQHEMGWFDTFEVPVFQNAYEAQARGLSAETRHRASNLKPGKYLKGRVTVEVSNAGVHIKYPVSGDNLMKNMALWRDFPDLIDQLWAEQPGPTAA